jgi:GlpG protein
MGEQEEGILSYLRMTPIMVIDGEPKINPTLPEIRHGEVWRLITPIFIHFGPMHLLFNLWCLYNLGGVVEIQRGWFRVAALVLVSALISNLAQLLFKGPGFGGMSGVVYALLGYAWMKSRFDPSAGIYIAPDTVMILVGWLFLCMTPLMPINVANHAHVGGLVVGLIVGIAPTIWRKVRRA